MASPREEARNLIDKIGGNGDKLNAAAEKLKNKKPRGKGR